MFYQTSVASDYRPYTFVRRNASRMWYCTQRGPQLGPSTHLTQVNYSVTPLSETSPGASSIPGLSTPGVPAQE